MTAVRGELRDAGSGRVLIGRLISATALGARTKGFLARTVIDDDEALWFDRTSVIHTLGMRVPIDVVFLNARGRVLKIAAAVKPWRPWVGRLGARSVVELACGNAGRAGITQDMTLEMRWDSPG